MNSPDSIKAPNKHSKNPFLRSVRSQEGEKRATQKLENLVLTNSETQETVATGGIWTGVKYDRTPFVKLFAEGFLTLSKLTSPGLRVLEILLAEVQKNKEADLAYLSHTALDQSTHKIDKNSFSRGVNNLIEHQFIARSTKPNLFFINPAKIWNGDRLYFLQNENNY